MADQYKDPFVGGSSGQAPARSGPIVVQPGSTLKRRGAEADVVSKETAAARTAALKPGEVELQNLQIEEARRKETERLAAEAAAKEAKATSDQEQRQQLAGFLEDLQRARDLLSNPMATGPAGQLTGGVYGSPAADLEAVVTALKAPIVLKAMRAAREGSKAGATGFGQLSNKEMDLLASTQGSLSMKQSREQMLQTINRLEQSWRRLMAYNAGYDPAKPEGAALVGLALPEGSEPPEPTGGELGGGEWTKNPELRGVDAAVTSMIKAGRSPAQIRQWLNEYQPGLGDKAQNIDINVDYWRKTGKDPNVTVERQFVPSKNALTSMGTGPAGAFATGAAEQATAGFLDELSGDRQRAAAVQRGLQEENPISYALGSMTGAMGSALVPEALAAKYGLRLPALLQGLPQNIAYGVGSAEPGERASGAFYEGLMTPVTNLAGNIFGKAIGVPLQGAEKRVRDLADRYGINLTPGQMTGGGGTERTLEGVPLVGPQIRARRNETLTQFNKAAFDEALAPIGVQVSRIGQGGVADAQAAYRKAYSDALGGVTLQLDPTFAQQARGKAYSDLGQLREIGPELQKEVDDIFARYADPNGTLSGEGMQNALQDLQTLKTSYKADPRWAKRIAPQIDDISDAYSGLLERQFPENYEMFRNANDAYRNVSILERAVDYGAEGDIFSPGNLRSATRQGTTRFSGKKASARGDRPFNELVMPALDVVPSKFDDTSLTGRILSPAIGTGAGAILGGAATLAQPDSDRQQGEGSGMLPAPIAYGLAGAGLASLPYSRFGTRGMTSFMRGSRTPQQENLGRLIETYLPAALRGGYRGATAEPGVPMPQGVAPLLDEKTQALIDQTSFAPAPTGAPQGESVTSINGRPVRYDKATDKFIDLETGEELEGYAHGGRVRNGFAYALGG